MQQEIPVLARPAAGGCLTISLPRAGGRVAEKRAVLAGRGVHICHTYTKHTQRNAGLLAGRMMLRSAAGCLPKGIRPTPESDKLAWTVSLAKRIKHWLNMRAGAKATRLSKPADRETGHQA